VLRRAGRRCQACGVRPATDVHHLTYAHLGAERAWELMALCVDCHRKAHGR
jgi:5-methylcytosine-specific restriction endonuclease McrA